ncbi:hypothetical protein ACFVRR_15915 [Gottfriedia sp. NPDC057948]|uniref:hypothetical protein n=1 Tax=Gottfriedia sp. NPDC057948 TaxID=3346287 RepID=UPI0036DF9DDA
MRFQIFGVTFKRAEQVKKITIFFCVLMMTLTLTACLKTETVIINRKEKMVSKRFIKVVTKRPQNTVKMPFPKNKQTVYEVVYQKEEIDVYKINQNVIIKNRTDWYTV